MSNTPPNVVAYAPAWGNARPARGISNLDKAQAFVQDFPPGAVLTRDAFCSWATAHGYLRPAPPSSNKPFWLQYQHEQADLLKKIRVSARSPAMQGTPSGPYRIEGGRGKMPLKVVALDGEHLVDQEVNRPIETRYNTLRQQVKQELQSADWANLPPHLRFYAEGYWEEFKYFEEDLTKLRVRNHARLERTKHAIQVAKSTQQMQMQLPPPISPGNDDTLDDLGL